MTNEEQIEYADLIEDDASVKGFSGRFLMSLPDGDTFEVPFYYDAESNTLALHGIEGHELVAYRTSFHKDARKAWQRATAAMFGPN